MGHSLINPNQIREYGVPVYDNLYNKNQFGIEDHEAFIPFNTKGIIVYFKLEFLRNGSIEIFQFYY